VSRWLPASVSRLTFFVVLVAVSSVRCHDGAAGIVPNRQCHSDWVREVGQIHAFALRLECENVVAEVHNLNLQAHSVDDPLKRKSSMGNLLEGTRRNRYGEGANLQGHVFGQRVNPIAVRTQGEGFLQIEAPLRNFELSEGRGERHQRGNSD
jgi:hypothetical protein